MSLRTLFVLPCYIILTIGFSLIALFVALFDSSGNSTHRIAALWSNIVLFISGVRTQLFNSEVLIPGQSYIFAANHRSAYDIPVLLAKLPIQFRWLAKESLFKIPLFGWAMKRAGYIPNQSFQSQDRLTKASLWPQKKSTKGHRWSYFPEGTRQEHGSIRRV